MATITAPLDEAVAFLLAEARGARRVRGARRRGTTRSCSRAASTRRSSRSSRARASSVELVANRVDARPDGWRVLWSDDDAVPGLRRPLQAARAAGRPAARLRRRRLLRPLRRARGRPRLRAARPRRLPRLTKRALRAVRDLRRRCCCAYLSRTTSRSRPSASARSASTSRTSGTRAGCTASSARARCGSRRRPAASTSSRSTPRPRRWSRSCSGSSSTSTRSRPGPPAQPVLDELVPKLEGFRPPLAPDPFESLVTSITAQQVSLFAAFAIRTRLDRALRRAAARSRTASRRARASSTRARTTSSRSASRGARPST